MNRLRLIVGMTVGVLLVVSLVAWSLQPSAVDVARRHCADRGVAPESLALLGYRGSGGPLGQGETVTFQVRGAGPAKHLVVELRRPAYFLSWQAVGFREEVQG